MAAISIIMTYRNAGALIHASVASVLAQTHSEWELLLIDDNLPQQEEIFDFQDSRIRRLRNPQPGRVRALAYGVEKAAFDYIAILDADDIWHPEKLAHDMKALTTEECGFVCWRITTFTVEAALPKWSALPERRPVSRTDMLMKNHVIHSTCAGRKEYFQYDTTRQTSEDYELCLRLQAEGVTLWKFNQVGAAFRLHDSHFTKRRWRYTLASTKLQARHIVHDRAFWLLPLPILRLGYAVVRHPLRRLQARLREAFA
ncbi:MAG: glycosyltransferase [Alphaproteobacteria bacterium]|jgi:glycosyltransferase involved in cell wall biosynthesis|nr:glycosyltransferase [Alphaproteobacteria bacterium]